MSNLNLYAIALYGSRSVCNRTNGILKDAVKNPSMKIVDFLMDKGFQNLVPFISEYCCHLSLLSALLDVEVSDKLNRQLADHPCEIIGSAASKSISSDDVLLVVCKSKIDSLDFLEKYVSSLVEESTDLRSFFIKQLVTKIDPEMEKTSYKVTLHCTLDVAQTIKDTVDSVFRVEGTYCPLQLLAMNFYSKDSFNSIANLVLSDVIHSYSIQDDNSVILNGYTIQKPYSNPASDYTFFANLVKATEGISAMKFVDQFYKE